MVDPITRREFLETGAAGAGMVFLSASPAAEPPGGGAFRPGRFTPPVTVSTWSHGAAASRVALGALEKGRSPLDAVEAGINVVELDPAVDSVGVGGLPGQDGVVTLDAAIMDGRLRCGAVLALREVATPISVARRVMERTRHIQLAGEGALRFALAQGFRRESILTPEARARWEKWRESPEGKAAGQAEDGKPEAVPQKEGAKSDGHDTVSLLALDARGAMAAGCSTSGLPWKMPGRVGDSPIIGAGLYVDGEVGAAAATGVGEEILRVSGSFLIVEGMRRGLSPAAAIEEALRRVLAADPKNRERQVAFIALSRAGEVAAGALVAGFQMAIAAAGKAPALLDVPAFG
jgi:N4-(beta-N-acetylglucosaminyl)-L-asparaginase